MASSRISLMCMVLLKKSIKVGSFVSYPPALGADFLLLVGGDFNILRKESDKNKSGGVNKWSFLFNSILKHHSLVELELMVDSIPSQTTVRIPLMRSWIGFW
jgi:hypothetical protein